MYVYAYVIPTYCCKLHREPNYLKVLFLFKFIGNWMGELFALLQNVYTFCYDTNKPIYLQIENRNISYTKLLTSEQEDTGISSYRNLKKYQKLIPIKNKGLKPVVDHTDFEKKKNQKKKPKEICHFGIL